ncbi:MAG: Ribonucleotide monophosphatase NagD [Pedosphaera sp.]|nr:Ribonucleotide monophosphatase NagD [Pedosphaera sp.]
MALDMDGTIYSGGTLFSDTVPFLKLLNRLGVGYTFLTNNSSKSVSDYVAHLQRMGITAAADEFFTSTQASVEYLREEMPKARRLFVLGTESMRKEIASAGFVVTADDPSDEPDAVLVGFDTALTFARLCRTAHWIRRGKPFIASHPDRVCPTDEPTVLVDCGSVCAALKEATGRGPDAVLGKPDPRMLRGLLQSHGLRPENLAMVGDRLYTDMEMARRAGAFGVLVLTGETTLADARQSSVQPDLIVSNLAELGAKLVEAK